MKVVTYLEQALEEVPYSGLGDWRIPEEDIEAYSISKRLFPYQVAAIQNAIKVLHAYFEDAPSGKEKLLGLCEEQGLRPHRFDVKASEGGSENPRFSRLTQNGYFPVDRFGGERIIPEVSLFNRTCFWMATGSGKTLLIIKMIEILDTLYRKGLIPRKEIMVLFPSEKILEQFAEAVNEYNGGKSRPIELLSLKDFDMTHSHSDARDEIKVYSYRSDLFSDVEKAKKIDTVTYDNKGDWYVFMDEAHKGDKEDSLRQDYITIMSRNGFLFNFSATFTDELDFATTCCNFNLEKFIEAGYGKNIYLSESSFAFSKKSDDLTERDKQLQVLKSLVIFSAVKKAKKPGYYHDPLMITWVNEVNTDASDADLFFAEIAKIAAGEIKSELFEAAKEELLSEFRKTPAFQFGDERLILNDGRLEDLIKNISIQDLLSLVFNASGFGKIAVLEGGKDKEFALKLATSDRPFALFRIGNAAQYINKKLNDHYMVIKTYDEKHYFDDLNGDAGRDFNILIGSRMFYEGWDSTRPNVMNFINIGTGDAKKFVLQSLGRGVRIQPQDDRKRLKANDSNKEQLLETLFVFATNRNAVETILETMDTQRADETNIALRETPRPFELLIPTYEDSGRADGIAKFNISPKAYARLQSYVGSFSDELLFLLTKIQKEDLARLRAAMNDRETLFKFNDAFDYVDMRALLEKVIAHLSVNRKRVGGMKELGDEILHFRHMKIAKDQWTGHEKVLAELTEFIQTDSTGSGEDISELAMQLATKKITLDEFNQRVQAAKPETAREIGGVKLLKLPSHYYSPLILSSPEKPTHVKHSIDIESEVAFIESLAKHIEGKDAFEYEWAFSKIDQTMDDRSIAIPYFSLEDNQYHDFFPDFIFWQKKGSEYRITFVDPKGTKYAAYQSKVDAFEELFTENGKAKIFSTKGYSIQFALKLYNENGDAVGGKYRDYWFDMNDLSWIS